MLTTPAGCDPGSLNVLQRMHREFLEIPSLRLTLAQAQRLWNVDGLVCESLLAALVDVRFLVRARDGAFHRRDHAHAGIVAPRGLAARS